MSANSVDPDQRWRLSPQVHHSSGKQSLIFHLNVGPYGWDFSISDGFCFSLITMDAGLKCIGLLVEGKPN